MNPNVRVEVAGLTALDQMELEQEQELQGARFESDQTASGRLGQLPLVTMIVDPANSAAAAALIAALALWLAKTRREVKVRISRESSPDGWEKQEIEFHGKSSQDIASEVVEAVRQMDRR
jgi:hypothetical protein